VLTLVVCGAPLASRAPELLRAATERGWQACLVITSAAQAWLPGVQEIPAESPVPGSQRPRPDALLVFPLTFNTGNKWALGIADTYPLSLLSESLGAGSPIVAVPTVNDRLWAHPCWARSLSVLRRAGVVLVDPVGGGQLAGPIAAGAGEDVAARFNFTWALDFLGSPTPG
jgi:hypothetical protein